MKRIYAQGIFTAILDAFAPKNWSNATRALLASLGAIGATYLANELFDDKKPRRHHHPHRPDAKSAHTAADKPAVRAGFVAREDERRSARQHNTGEPGSPSR